MSAFITSSPALAAAREKKGGRVDSPTEQQLSSELHLASLWQLKTGARGRASWAEQESGLPGGAGVGKVALEPGVRDGVRGQVPEVRATVRDRNRGSGPGYLE